MSAISLAAAWDERAGRDPALVHEVANQAGNGLWWNAMAAATELVAACQRGCRADVERVAKKRASESPRKERRGV